MRRRSLGINALLNGIKECCSIILPFVSFAYCSRIIGSEGIGVYSFSQSIVAYFVLVAALGIPNYAIREGATLRDDDSNIRLFINQVFTINIISMILSYLMLAAVVLFISKFHAYWFVITILSLQLLLNTVGADWINKIFEDYWYLTIRYIVLQFFSIVFLFLFVKTKNDLIPYTIITMLSNVGGNLINIYYLRKRNIYPLITKDINFNRHLMPIIILFANSIAGVIYLNSDITMLGFYLSESEVGVYTVSSKIYSIVKSLINSVIMVTIPRFSYLIANNETDEYKKYLNSIGNTLIIICIPCIVGLVTEANKVLYIVAGSGYDTGVIVVKILAFTMIFAVAACYFSYSILIPHRKEKEFMIATVVAAVSNIIINFIIIPFAGITGTALSTLIAEIIVFGVTIYYSKKLCAIRIDKKSLFQVLIGCVAIFFTCKIIDILIDNYLISFAFECLISLLIYITFLAVIKNEYMKNFLGIFKLKKNINQM